MKIEYTNLLLEQTKDLIWLVDHHLNLVYANKAYLHLMKEVTGVEKELNTPILTEGFGEGYIEKWKAYYQKALSGKDFEIEEHFVNPKTGDIQFGYITFYPIKDEHGVTISVACRSSDFTPVVQQKNQAGLLLGASLDVFCTVNKYGNFVFISAAAKTHWGYLPEDLVNTAFMELVVAEDVAKTNRIAKSIFTGKEVKSFINRFKKKDGTIAYNSWSARWDATSNLMYCVARDAKETFEKNTLLQKSEEHFRALVQEASDLIAVIDTEGNYNYVSPSTTTILGILPETLLGNNAFNFIHPDDREKTLPYLEKIATEKTVKVPPFRFQNSKGEWHWIETTLTNMLDNPAIKGIVSNARDVTEKVKEERQRKLLESVITNTHDAVLITEAEPFDEPGPSIIYVNEAFTKMTGYTAEEVIGKTPRILQGPASDKKALAKLGKALRNWETHEVTTINYKKNGEEFWVNFTVTPVADETGWYTHWIAIERDVTDQKNKELENEFISKISLAFNLDNDFQKAADELCKSAGNFGIFDWVELWILNLEETEMRMLSYYIKDAEKEHIYEQSYKLSAIKTGEGFLGKLWKAKKSLIIEDIEKADFFLNKESVAHLGIKSLIGIPLLFNDKVIGVLKFGTKNNLGYLNSLLKISKQLETFIGSEIQRKRIERDLSYLFDAIPDIISLSDLQGRILRINKTGSELIGYAEEEIINEGFEKFIHPDDLQIAYEELSKLGEGNNTFGFEVRFITKSGKTIWLSWYCKSNVKEGLIYATAKNITKEKYLSELNKQTRKLAKIGSWEVDLIKNEIYWSDEVYELHELDRNSYKPDVASTILFYKEEYRPIIESYVATAIETGKSFDFEAIIITAKKQERWVRAIGTTEFNNGKCIKIFGSFQDIHEKKMSEEQLVAINEKLEIQTKELQRSNEELEQFAFITSHDLQEPLRMISSYMDQLKRKYADKLDDKAIQYIHFATDGAKRMKEIILDLLAYSRANRPNEQKELLNLNEIVSEFLQLRRKLIAEKKASINSSKLPVIDTYTAPITQIFHCLLDNALKYSKENVPPIINIDVKETTDFWEFSITDNGIGIDPVFFEKIFILFQRLHNRKEYGGTGIGLSIAKRSVEFLGGKIWLSSEPDKGTTFYFTIPKN